jgi:glutamine amidotransferase
MCRVLSYLGHPISIDELLYKPDNSLIIQTYNPRLMSQMMLNLAGFGLTAWDRTSHEAHKPFIYRTHGLPFYEENLKNMATKIVSHCLIAHVRGVEYSEKNVVSNQNVHPFLFDNTNIAFAHNGSLAGFSEIRYEIADNTRQEYKIRIKGTTDSEWMYALFLSQLPQHKTSHKVNDIFDAILTTIDILQHIRKKNAITISSPLNFFISDGSFIVATRYVLDYGKYSSHHYNSAHMIYHSLWYTYGDRYGCYQNEYKMKTGKKKKSIIIASEPLTKDSTTWIEVPEYSFISAEMEKNEIQIKSLDIVL